MLHAVYSTRINGLRMFQKIKVPILLVLAILLILAMLRLAVWQMDRAEQKQVLLDQVALRAQQSVVSLASLVDNFDSSQHRYTNVLIDGHYLPEKSVYVDNNVIDGQVGYQVFTPFEVLGADVHVMVNRGWLPVGDSREQLPSFTTSTEPLTLNGRLNNPPAQPPLWNDSYPVSQGPVWAYLPINEYASQMQLKLLPLVVELAPQQTAASKNEQFVVKWPKIDDEWVAKHKGYAFQWLMMALAFFIACLVLLIRSTRQAKTTNDDLM